MPEQVYATWVDVVENQFGLGKGALLHVGADIDIGALECEKAGGALRPVRPIIVKTEDFVSWPEETKRLLFDVIIVDECQFLTAAQIDQLRDIVDVENIPVLCFGLRTDFQCKLFDGSRRLFEVADTITEIKAICDCGAKATVNARLDSEGCIVTEGAQLLLGGNDRYIAMCHKCWVRNIREHRKVR